MRSTTEPVIVKHDSRNNFPLYSTIRGPGVPIEQRRKSMLGLSMKINDLGRKYWFKLDMTDFETPTGSPSRLRPPTSPPRLPTRRTQTPRVPGRGLGAGSARTLRLGGRGSAFKPPPKSPGRKPKPINKAKYEKMLKNIVNAGKAQNAFMEDNFLLRNVNIENNNVAAWFDNNLHNAKKSNIPRSRRVFILSDVSETGKIKHVYDRKFINNMIKSFEEGFEEVFARDHKFFKSPVTNRKFSKDNIKAYPPTPNTKRLIRNRNRL